MLGRSGVVGRCVVLGRVVAVFGRVPFGDSWFGAAVLGRAFVSGRFAGVLTRLFAVALVAGRLPFAAARLFTPALVVPRAVLERSLAFAFVRLFALARLLAAALARLLVFSFTRALAFALAPARILLRVLFAAISSLVGALYSPPAARAATAWLNSPGREVAAIAGRPWFTAARN